MDEPPANEPLTLTNVPKDVLRSILDFCDYPAIASLRKTCTKMRGFLNDSMWQCSVSSIHVQQREDHAVLQFQSGQSTKVYSMEYRSADGSDTQFDGDLREYHRRIHRPTHFMHPFFNDFGLLLEHTKESVSDEFHLEFDNIDLFTSTRSQDASYRVFTERLQGMLTRDELVKTKSLTMTVPTEETIANFVPLFDATCLKKLKLTRMGNRNRQPDGNGRRTFPVFEANVMAEMEQWRNAEELIMEDTGVYGNVEHLLHFKRIDVNVYAIGFHAIESMMRTLMNRGDMESRYVVRGDTLRQFFHDRYGEPLERKFYFRLPETNCILMVDRLINIDMRLISHAEVPDQARIVDLDALEPPQQEINGSRYSYII